MRRKIDLIIIFGLMLYGWAMVLGVPMPPTEWIAAIAFWGYGIASAYSWRREA
jgi:hypothetical protein